MRTAKSKGEVCSYCKGSEKSVEHTRPKDCPRYQAYKAGKGKKKMGRRAGSVVKSVGGGGLSAALVHLREQRRVIDQAIEALEKLEAR